MGSFSSWHHGVMQHLASSRLHVGVRIHISPVQTCRVLFSASSLLLLNLSEFSLAQLHEFFSCERSVTAAIAGTVLSPAF